MTAREYIGPDVRGRHQQIKGLPSWPRMPQASAMPIRAQVRCRSLGLERAHLRAAFGPSLMSKTVQYHEPP